MQYENYQRKVEKIASAIQFVFRHMVKIVIAMSVVMACVSALLITRGIITEEGTCPESIVYGDDVKLGAKAFMSKITYEYSESGTDDWSENMPKLPGTYLVRAVSKGTFGYKRYTEPSTFKILPKTLTVTPGTSFVYGDDPVPGAFGLIRGDKIAECEFIYADMNGYSARVTPDKETIVIKDTDGVDVTVAYNISVKEDTLSMSRRPVTITVHDKTAEYNGQPLSSDSYEITAGDVADGDSITLKFDKTITYVSEILNTPSISIVDSEGNDVKKFYDITQLIGKLKITPKPLHVLTSSNEWTYNDETFFDEGYSFIDGTSPLDEHKEFVYVVSRAEMVDVGSEENKLRLAILIDGVQDVTYNYDISYTYGTLKVNKKPITITTSSSSQVYNDTDLSDTRFSVNGAVQGHLFTVEGYPSITNVSVVENDLTFTVINGSGRAVDIDNYDITYEYGTLEVTKRPLVINTGSKTFVYDSMEHCFTDCTSEGLLSNHTLAPIDDAATIIFVGNCENTVGYKVMKGNLDVSDNYDISYTYGTLTVEKAPLKIITLDKSFTYDGTAHSFEEFMSEGLASNDTVRVKVGTAAAITETGSCRNTFEITVVNKETNEDVSDNYVIEYTYGTLTVNKRPITVNPNDVSKIYDATMLYGAGFTVSQYSGDGLANGHKISADVIGGGVDAGEYILAVLNVKITDENGKDVTHNYDITLGTGKATVEQRPVHINTHEQTWMYDGKHHYCEGFTISPSTPPVEGHVFIVTSHTQVLNFGNSDNELTFAVKDESGADVTKNYLLSFSFGKISITKRPITVKTDSNQWVYNDELFSDPEFEIISDIKTAEGQTLILTGYTSIRNAGSYKNYLTLDVRDEYGNMIPAKNYDITFEYGTLIVTRRVINITTATQTWEYDGEYHSNTEPTYDSAELVAGHTIEVVNFQEVRFVTAAYAYNAVTYKIMSGVTNVTENYRIVYNFGTLTVTARKLVVTTGTASLVYNGQEQQCNDYTVEGLADGDFIDKIVNNTYQKDVGSVDNVFSVSAKSHDGIVVTNCYDIEYIYGTLAVIKRPVTIKPADVSKVYDAKILIGDGTFTAENLVVGHTITSADVSGGGIDAGTYDLVAFNARISDKNGVDVTHNYDVTYVAGKATVERRPITVITSSATKLYDGEPLTSGDYSVDESEPYILLPGHTISVEVTGSVTEAFVIAFNTVDESKTVINDEYGNDVTANYEVRYKYGQLYIKGMELVVSTPYLVFEYNGKEQFSTEYSVITDAFEIGGKYEGYVLSVDEYTVCKDATAANNPIENRITIRIENPLGEDVTKFFCIVYDYGRITVNRKKMTVTTDSGEWTYDGNYHSNTSYTVDGIIDMHSHGYNDFTNVRDVLRIFPEYTGDMEHVSWSDDAIDYGDSYVLTYDNFIDVRIYDELGADVTENYDIAYKNGRLRILPLDVTVTTESFEYVYDGNTHYIGGEATVAETIPEGDTYSVILTSTGEGIREVGAMKNLIGVVFYHRDNGANCTDNYNVTYVYGYITVVQRKITLKPDGEKVYDGLEFVPDKFVTTESSEYTLVAGHTVEADVTGTLINVGSCECSIIAGSVRIFDRNGVDVTHNYDVITEKGIITVTHRIVELLSDSATKKYDGTPLTDSGYTVINGDALAMGHVLSNIRITGSIKFVGEAPNTFDEDSVKVYSAGADVTENYKFVFNEGMLTVTPAADVIIMTESLSKVYDGTPLTCHKCNYYTANGVLVAGDHVEITVTGTITLPGKALNTADYVILDSNGNDVTGGYNIIEKFGTLEVLGINIDIDDDGQPDINIDVDSDGKADINIDVNGDMKGDINLDINGDGNGELNLDTDGDGKADTNVDTNGDNIPDKNIDTDGDGVADSNLGEGGTVGDSSGKINSSGNIQAPDFGDSNGENIICYVVRSEQDGKLYLRFKSFGNYNGGGFHEANAYYDYIDSKYSALYLTALALSGSGNSAFEVEIISRNGQYVIPYYTVAEGVGQKSDVVISGDTDSAYTLHYYTLSDILGLELPTELVIYEQKYRKFVYDNYLKVDSETLEFMQALIESCGFDPTSPTIIDDVAKYISQEAANYNLNYDRRLDESDNIVISFLRDYKEGICQHYAASAVMLYRALGIPARYTTGFVADAKAGEYVEVSAMNAHAWVEIYVNGIGWVMVEVTGASSNPDFGDSSWDGEIEEEPIEITIAPIYQSKEYDGTPLYAENAISADMVLEELLAKGYRYEVTVSGYRTEPGRGVSHIESFKLYDSEDNDVTDRYKIIYEDGVLEVAHGIIKIFLYEIQKYYDGKALVYSSEDYEIINDLPAGVTVDVSINISLTDCALLTNSEINTHRDEYISYKVYDNGVDVTDMYLIVLDVFEGMSSDTYIPIRVDKRSIELTSASASKGYDGTFLMDQDVYITKGSLANGDRLQAFASGQILDKGSCENTVYYSNIRILNADNQDVTDNYDITVNEGTLTVF